jgi:uncharacterized membrane protein
MTAVEISTTILSLVALAVTVIGFFASLRFYLEGMKHQALANEALVKLEEKVQSIQTQVGGLFDKTLDAAISRDARLTSDFRAIEQQLEESTKAIVDSSVSEINKAGQGERERISAVVEEQVKLIRDRIEETRENAEEAFESAALNVPHSAYQAKVLALIAEQGNRTTLQDISAQLGTSHGAANKVVRRLADRGLIEIRSIGNHTVYAATERGREISRLAATQSGSD